MESDPGEIYMTVKLIIFLVHLMKVCVIVDYQDAVIRRMSSEIASVMEIKAPCLTVIKLWFLLVNARMRIVKSSFYINIILF